MIAKKPTVAPLALLAWLAWSSSSSAPAVRAQGDPFGFFAPIVRVTPAERKAVDGGRVIVRALPATGREIAVFAAGALTITPDALIARVRDIVELKKSRYVPAIARFSQPPVLEDLARLALDDVDLGGLRRCRPGDCGLKLGDAEMGRVRRAIAAAGREWKTAAQEEFRQIVLDRLRSYLADGQDALSAYHDDPRPLRPAAVFSSLLERSPYLTAGAPELARYLQQFPHAPLPGAESFLYWSKESFGRKPIVSVTHVTIVRGDASSGGPEVLVVSKQLFATHYTNGALAVTALVRSPGAPRRYLAYLNRSAIDAGGILRLFIERRVKSETEQIFRIQLRRFEGVMAPED